MRKESIKKARRVVVKVGSNVLAAGFDDKAGSDAEVFGRIARDLHEAKAAGREVVLVSSGAIAMGIRHLELSERPVTIPERQAVAAVGQVRLMANYDAEFSRHGDHAAQVLLTHGDLADRKRFLNARNTLVTLIGRGIIPVINENDTVAVDEIKFGDNDNLAALVTNLIEADLLVMLTDTGGIYDRDPKADPAARVIAEITDIDAFNLDWVGAGGGEAGKAGFGTGGIVSKIEAAKKAAHFGCSTIVASGLEPGILTAILAGKDVGTFIAPKQDILTSKKHWIAYSTRPSGRVIVDDGARGALLGKGKSLLPAGIKSIDGVFEAGEVIHCVDMKGMEFARGVVNYSSREIESIMGLKTTEIEKVLGYKVYDEVIHRDNLVVL